MSLRPHLSGRSGVLCHIDLIQDLDVLLPVILAARRDRRVRFHVIVSRWLETSAPRVTSVLRANGIPFRLVPRRQVTENRMPGLSGISAVLTAAESNQATHTAGHALARRAQNAGIPTFTLQHGLDSLGGQVTFASDRIFCWFRSDCAPGNVSPETRARLLPVGRPLLPRSDARPEFDVGVFENLHADTYTDADRAMFVARLDASLSAHPDLSFLIRPHPAGRWLEAVWSRLAHHQHATLVPGALSLKATTPAYHEAGRCRRVITTPSTVALDALLLDRPVALALHGCEPYEPLHRLEDTTSWSAFCEGALDVPSKQGGSRLLKAILTDGDPADRILDHLAGAPPLRSAAPDPAETP